jgi:predicted tellurium resistance membrane protein TerC
MTLEIFTQPAVWAGLLTLTVLEIVLGIDNLVFISIVTNRLPLQQQKKARQIGLLLACLTRLLLLATISWIVKLTTPLFSLWQQTFSWRDLILIGGGLFLLVKGTSEIHQGMVSSEERPLKKISASFSWVIIQIMFLDIIFSLDSVITAVGMVKEFIVMALAIVIAVLLMLVASEPLSRFIHKYPSLKILALSFLLLVGMALIADGFQVHIPRGYLYFAIAFSIVVEIFNLLSGRRRAPKINK